MQLSPTLKTPHRRLGALPEALDESSRLAQPEDWEGLLQSCDDVTPFHTDGWLEAAERHTKSAVFRLAMLSGKEFVGGCPLFLTVRRGLALLASPPPGASAPYLGPIWKGMKGLKERTRLAHLERFAELVDRLMTPTKSSFALLRLPPETEDIRPFLWRGFGSRLRYTYRVPLTPPEPEIWESFSSSLRRRIRGAGRHLEVRPGTMADIPRLFTAVEARFKAQGLQTVLSRGYLEDIFRSRPAGGVEILVCEKESMPVNAVLLLKSPQSTYSWVGPVRPRDPKDGSTQLLFWNAIRGAKREGKERFEIIGAEGKKLVDFKAQFNPQLTRFYEVFKGRGIGRLAALWRQRG